MNTDPAGTSVLLILGGILLGALVGGLINGTVSAASGGDFIAGFVGGAVAGAISTVGAAFSLATGGLFGLAASAFFGAVSSFGGNIIQQGMEKSWNNIVWENAFLSAGIGAFMGMAMFGINNITLGFTAGAERIFDKTVSLGARFASAPEYSPVTLMSTAMFSLPLMGLQLIIEKIFEFT